MNSWPNVTNFAKCEFENRLPGLIENEIILDYQAKLWHDYSSIIIRTTFDLV
jgi:hypothetical protein